LWTVDDGGTQALMNAFYATLKTNNTTKAEALQQAQIALITGSNNLSHPYYWAPFILIGNGL
jgi:CHAT domain-containing protein